MVSARSIPPSRVAFIVRPARCIQKIIQVTMPTASSDSEPPISSWAVKVSSYAPKVSTAPIPRARAIASPTPAQSFGSASCRPSRRR